MFVLSLLVLQSFANYTRLSPNNSAILFIDLQTGLFDGVADQSQVDFKNNVLALVDAATVFNLSAVLTTSFETGPNGPMLPEIVNAFPNVSIIRRPGQINAFDNPDFVTAVNNTGMTKLIIAGISTDVCVTFAALSAIDLGYDVYAVIDASGTWSPLVRETAMQRMQAAGVHMMSWDAVASELQADWRNPTAPGYAQLLSVYLPFYGNLVTLYNYVPPNATNATNATTP